jgi:hypothetical protein
MQRFHFNAHKGDQVIVDLEGEMLPDIDAARKEAIASARETLSNSIRSGDDPPDSIQVVDGDGKTVLTIALLDLMPRSMKR